VPSNPIRFQFKVVSVQFLFRMGYVMENNIYASPEANLEIEQTIQSDLASRWNRLWASLIDGLTMIPIMLPIMYFTGGLEGLKNGVQPSLIYTLTMALIGVIIFVIIHGKWLIADGQTLGKRALNIKIVTVENKHASLAVLAKRYGFSMLIPQIPFIGALINFVNLLFIFTKSKRCLHDLVAGTKVVIATKPEL
jgi:uncharacterized RDD family membrane protein YckC